MTRSRRGGLIAVLALCALWGGAAGSGHAAAAAPPRSALIAFVSAPAGQPAAALGARLARLPGLSLGLLSADEGGYRTAQMLLDISQGARIATASYTRRLPVPLRVVPAGDSAAVVPQWPAVLRRAHDAPAGLQPGLLSSSIPGGAAYSGSYANALAAVAQTGRVATESLATAARSRRLVVADLPAGEAGLARLRALLTDRPRSRLVIVVQRVPDRPGNELLWIAAGGLGANRELTSDTTNQHGIVSAVDIAPTVLDHLGLPIPAAMNGRLMRTTGTLDVAHLRRLADRLRTVNGRRLPTLLWLVIAWVALLAGCAAFRRARRAALRIGGLAMLWSPSASLVTAALAPAATAEKLILVALCFGLGALTDRLAPWPRAVIVPAVVNVVALTVDALAGTQLLLRSLLGPNPAYGARFYGIGNELKSGLAVLVFAAVAAALWPGERSRRAALAMAVAGVLLAVVEGSARLGAGVGGVILVAAGTAVATILVLPGVVNRRRVLIVLASPVLALIVLAGLDLATAHGTGHYTGSVLHAHSAADLKDVLVRRYGGAWGELRHGGMPIGFAFALILSIWGVRNRDRLLAPAPDPLWRAALAGGLTAGVVGTLVEDSGPVLLVVAVFALICVLAYLHGAAPETAPISDPHESRPANQANRVATIA